MVLPLFTAYQLHGRTHHVFICRDHIQAFQFGLLNEFLQGVLVGEKVIETAAARVFAESQAGGGIGLRVAINQQRPHLGRCQRRR